MGLMKSLVEITHDDGYGDLLLMHINHAFACKDMRAERVVGPVALSVKIEKPKRYRPFANAAEFEPHRDKWLVFFDYEYSDLSDQKSRVLVYGDDRFWIGEDGSMYDWNEAFKSWQFEDGTPFGVEVTE